MRMLTDANWMDISNSTVVINNGTDTKKVINGHSLQVVRGTLSPQHFVTPFRPNYQRDVLLGTRKKQAELIEAMTGSKGIPDPIILCLRSENVRVLGGDLRSGRDFVLNGPLAILDGLQRLAAGCKAIEEGRRADLCDLEVTVYINTTEDLEEKMFDQFNRLHTEVGSQVHMRNLVGISPAARELCALVDPSYERTPEELAEAEKFVLFGRVQLDQTSESTDLITLRMLLELATAVHGSAAKKTIPELINSVSQTASLFGGATLLRNTKVFFETINECFPLDKRPYYTQLDFLRAFAVLFSGHEDFWNAKNNKLLYVPAPIKKRLASTPEDMILKELKGSRQAAYHLSRVLVHRIDGPKRDASNMLQPRARLI
jgi:hypothetical protein